MKTFNPSLTHRLESILGKKISSIIPVVGGDINRAFRISTEHDDYFIKINSASKFPDMFRKEAFGLLMLKDADGLHIPLIIAQEEIEDISFLLMEYLHPGARSAHYWRDLGHGLATVHNTTAPVFGLEESNYIGSLVQQNTQQWSWIDFFVQERITPMIKRAHDHHLISNKLEQQFKSFINKVGEIFPLEAPALLHGDLWIGNQIPDASGNPCLIDPAIYFGHREMDIAMTRLFGHFSTEFYHAYHETYPLKPEWEERMVYYNLYPLLVHLNLFGTSYLPQIEDILEAF
jgi:Fructosamine-3-kinase